MKLLILDRDGTLNRSREDYVASADEWEALPGALVPPFATLALASMWRISFAAPIFSPIQLWT